MLNFLKTTFTRKKIDFRDSSAKLKDAILHDNLLILQTTVGQFTFNLEDCDFVGERDTISFLFSRKNSLGQVENFDLRLDNTAFYKKNNSKIILKIKKAKSKK